MKSRIVKKDLSRSEIQKAIQFGQPSLQKISKPIETIGERNRNVIDNSGGDGSNLMTDSMNELSQPVKRSPWMNKAQSSPIVDSDEEDDEEEDDEDDEDCATVEPTTTPPPPPPPKNGSI